MSLESTRALIAIAKSHTATPRVPAAAVVCLEWCVNEIDRLRADIALLGPVTTPLNGKQCAKCGLDCCDHWTYCPSCGARGRVEDQSVRVKR